MAMATKADSEETIGALENDEQLDDDFSKSKLTEDNGFDLNGVEVDDDNADKDKTIESVQAQDSEESVYEFIKPISLDNLEVAIGEGRGIEWFNNSCYIDATLYSMFSFNHLFDNLLVSDFPPNYSCLDIGKTIQMIIRDQIVNPLRNGLMVSSKTVMKLRTILGKWDSGFISSEMEPQEFLLTLFREILSLKPFLELANDNGGDYFHNILMESPSTFPEEIYAPSVLQILKESFTLQGIQFSKCPYPALMLPLPIFYDESGAHKPFTAIIPNQTIDISQFISREYKCIKCSEPATCECTVCDMYDQYYCDKCFKSQHKSAQKKPHAKCPIKCELHLSAVLCCLPSARHFVSFVKCGPRPDSPWVFFNSMGGKNLAPSVDLLDNLGNLIKNLEDDPSRIRTYLETGDVFVRTLLTNPYMYIYIPN